MAYDKQVITNRQVDYKKAGGKIQLPGLKSGTAGLVEPDDISLAVASRAVKAEQGSQGIGDYGMILDFDLVGIFGQLFGGSRSLGRTENRDIPSQSDVDGGNSAGNEVLITGRAIRRGRVGGFETGKTANQSSPDTGRLKRPMLG